MEGKKMLALEIYINDTKPLVVGSKDWATLFIYLFAYKSELGTTIQMDAGVGLEQAESGKLENLRWKRPKIAETDEIRLRFVHTDDATEPDRRYRSDHNVQESPYTEEEKA